MIAGDHRAAYARTGLGSLATTSDEATTLSFVHFRAFHLADPLESYAVSEVTRLDRRTIDTVGQTGTPYFVVDITLRQRSRTIDTTISVDGSVLGVVEIEPVPVRIRAPAGVLLIDGEPAPMHPGGERTLLLLAGAHTLSREQEMVRFSAPPLEVGSGPASVDAGVIVLH